MGIDATPPVVPVLQTPRLRLRPLQAEDAEALHDAYANPQVMRHWSLAPSGDLAETRRRIAWSLAASVEMHAAWAITQPPDDRLIGLVNYHHREASNRRLEIGYLLMRGHWRQGLMREALVALLDHFFVAFDVHRVEAMVEPSNLPSRRLLEGLGFACESGVLRDRIKVGDAYRSMVMYALLAPDWKAATRR
ncbi:GNAT family N-acetyltransferase [Desertibaculum subflavum]|uniref:GNAT family N-acetyltransferase n=1 Tax=Desertibaculum subflavum TaxID=2268458 RepID=UPI0013C49882